MPATSLRQLRLMQAAAHNPKFARKVGISPAQAAEFVAGQKPAGLPERKKAKK